MFYTAKPTVMVITNAIVDVGQLLVTIPRIVIPANSPLAMLQSSFSTRLPVSGFGDSRGLGSVGITIW